MNTNDIIVLIEFDYKNDFDYLVNRATIQRFPFIDNESCSELRERLYKWLGNKGYDRRNIYDLRLTYEGNI